MPDASPVTASRLPVPRTHLVILLYVYGEGAGGEANTGSLATPQLH